jgi:hypothetical protein
MHPLMNEPAYSIEVVDKRLEIRFRGKLEESLLTDLLDAATRGMKDAGTDFDLVYHLDDVEDCPIMARAKIIDTHSVLAPRARRTAFISKRSRFRGLALWIMRVAGDERGRSFVDWEQAREWLAERIPPEQRKDRAMANLSAFLKTSDGARG